MIRKYGIINPPVQGRQGDQGDTGPTGPSGPRGPGGSRGPAGPLTDEWVQKFTDMENRIIKLEALIPK